MKRYATIDYALLKKSGLSINEWLLLDLVYFFSNNEYRACFASKKRLAENLGLSDRNIYRLINSLIQKNYLEKTSLSHLRVTKKYVSLITFDEENLDDFVVENDSENITEGMTEWQSGHDKMSVGSMTKCQSYPIKKEKRRKINKKEAVNVEVEEDLPISKELFEEFEEHRKKLKAPLTVIARKRLISKLWKLKKEGYDVEALVEDSIINGWKGVFADRSKKRGGMFSSRVEKNMDYIMQMDLDDGGAK